jgi:hypothetical protein
VFLPCPKVKKRQGEFEENMIQLLNLASSMIKNFNAICGADKQRGNRMTDL